MVRLLGRGGGRLRFYDKNGGAVYRGNGTVEQEVRRQVGVDRVPPDVISPIGSTSGFSCWSTVWGYSCVVLFFWSG